MQQYQAMSCATALLKRRLTSYWFVEAEMQETENGIVRHIGKKKVGCGLRQQFSME